ncbi:MAG: hypothetical protein R3286_10860 [Gammaproteobacteria bacterium]|nr:hypothetical protein [Gammaproteobacteria bacterium]
MLYEEQLSLAPILCLQCATYFVTGERGPDRCPDCGAAMEAKVYEEWFRHAFYAVRFGIQYRSQGEVAPAGPQPAGASRQGGEETTGKPFLPPLVEVYTFLAMAAIGYLNGGANRELSKRAMRRIIENWNSISGDAERLDYAEADVDGFIDSIERYFEDVKGIKSGAGAQVKRPPTLPRRMAVWSRL